MKRLFACCLALLVAGSAFFFVGRAGCVKTGVVISGVEVGGMPYAEAVAAVRKKLAAERISFTVHTPFGDTMPEIDYADDVPVLVRRAKKGETLEAAVRREWVEAEEEIARLCERAARAPADAALTFGRFGFSYVEEQSGVYCDYGASLAAALKGLREGAREVSLITRVWKPAVTEAELRARTQKLSSFSTYFDASKTARAHNIALACERIAGSVLLPGEVFSFNAAVGLRTAENGFLEAPIISGGEYVAGIGGGVCQASTTLMNAALCAGLTVTESRPHSLSVGYVLPSLDAMVSRYSDLKFCNPYEFPVYLLGKTSGGTITFEVYGKPDGMRYETESRVLCRIAPPEAEVREGEEDKTVRAEKEGLRSESYLLVYDAGGALVRKKLLRRDSYAAVQGIYERKGVTDFFQTDGKNLREGENPTVAIALCPVPPRGQGIAQ